MSCMDDTLVTAVLGGLLGGTFTAIAWALLELVRERVRGQR